MRDEQVIAVTEQGEAHITNALLLDIIQDVIVQSAMSDDIEGPTGMYLLSAVNLLGKLGWLEVRTKGEPPSSKAEVDTSEPPRFISNWFTKEKPDDASPDN